MYVTLFGILRDSYILSSKDSLNNIYQYSKWYYIMTLLSFHSYIFDLNLHHYVILDLQIWKLFFIAGPFLFSLVKFPHRKSFYLNNGFFASRNFPLRIYAPKFLNNGFIYSLILMYGYLVKTVLSKYSKVGSHMKQNRM